MEKAEEVEKTEEIEKTKEEIDKRVYKIKSK